MFAVFSLVVAVSAMMSFINHKLLKLPPTIGVMILSILVAFLIWILSFIHPEWYHLACEVVLTIDFRVILFDFLLCFLLFAGAIHVNLQHLLEEKRPVIIFATVGVLISTFVIGTITYYASEALGVGITFKQSLVFGALISPTDPVAVLSLLQKANVAKKMEIKIIGESLFNDGVGIVVFLTLLALAGGGEGHGHGGEVSAAGIAESFFVEAGGGVIFGILLGYIGIYFLKAVNDEPIIEVHITLGIVMAGYALASLIGVSGALAIVIAGIMIGNRLSKPDMPEPLKKNLNTFWKILDEVLNAILFVMIGIEMLILGVNTSYILLSLITIPTVILARLFAVWLSNFFVGKDHHAKGNAILIITWAGLRGGISIALALTLAEGQGREPILFITYVVVVFSILVQGLSIEKLVKKLSGKTPA